MVGTGAGGQYHGRILYPVQSAQQVRRLVPHDKPQGSAKIVLESSTHVETKNPKKGGSRSNNKSRSSIDHDHDEDNDEGVKIVLTR